MGPLKALGRLFTSLSNSVEYLDNSVEQAKRLQKLEHAKELDAAMKEFNVDAESMKQTMTKHKETIKQIDDVFAEFR